jgi:uncharacterized protein YjlB
MYTFESAKSSFEKLTGWGQPKPGEIKKRIKKAKPRATVFKDNSLIPNNPTLPFLHYRKVASLARLSDPAALFERLFKTNGWVDAWRNGIYDYVHYHPRTHEVLGIARGRARVRFGGKKGRSVDLSAGDVVVLPAGTGHEALRATKDLLVVGAYPRTGKYDEYEGNGIRKSLADASEGSAAKQRPGVRQEGPLEAPLESQPLRRSFVRAALNSVCVVPHPRCYQRPRK